jgi:DNA-binding transcriptional regulator YiaG
VKTKRRRYSLTPPTGGPPVEIEEDQTRVTLWLPNDMVRWLRKAAKDLPTNGRAEISDVVRTLIQNAIMDDFEKAEMVDAETGAKVKMTEPERDRHVLRSIGLERVGSMSADELKGIRAALKLTQGELAEGLKVDVMTVSRWERGVVGIQPRQAFRIRRLAEDALRQSRRS